MQKNRFKTKTYIKLWFIYYFISKNSHSVYWNGECFLTGKKNFPTKSFHLFLFSEKQYLYHKKVGDAIFLETTMKEIKETKF